MGKVGKARRAKYCPVKYQGTARIISYDPEIGSGRGQTKDKKIYIFQSWGYCNIVPGRSTKASFHDVRPARVPQVGDEVVFAPHRSNKELAAYWGLKSQLEKIKSGRSPRDRVIVPVTSFTEMATGLIAAK